MLDLNSPLPLACLVALACLFCLVAARPSQAQLPTFPDLAVTPAEPRAFQQPSLAVDPSKPDRLAIAYQDGANQDFCGLALSSDGGKSWKAGSLVGNGGRFPLPQGFAECWDPTLAFGPDGTLYYTYEPRQLESGAAASSLARRVMLTVARPGRTFEAPRAIDPAGPGADYTDLWSGIAVDPGSGRVVVGWLRYCTGPDVSEGLGLGCLPNPLKTVVATSEDKGRSFSSPVQVNPPGLATPARQFPAIDAGGRIYQAFLNASNPFGGEGSSATLHVASSQDAGRRFGSPRRVAELRGCSGDLCYAPHSSAFPFVHALGGRRAGEAFLAWWNMVGNKNRVLFSSTRDGGASWSVPRLVGIPRGREVDEQHRPWLALTPRGRLYIAYYDTRPDGFHDVYLIDSSDGGQSFSTPMKLTDVASNAKLGPRGRGGGRALANFGQRVGVAATENAVFGAWTDSRRGRAGSVKQDVFFEGPAIATRRRCLSRRLRVGSRRIGPVRLGHGRARVIRRAGAPTRRSRSLLRYCVRGGGELRVAFPRRGGARLVATTARGHRRRGLGARMRLATVRRAYPRTYRIGRRLYAASRSSRVVFGVRRGRVRFVAVADRRVLKRTRVLRRYLRRARL